MLSNVIPEKNSISVKQTRRRGTTVEGKPFSSDFIHAVWEKSIKEFGFYFFRRDIRGATILRTDYGSCSQYGWEIDHIIPVSLGGTDEIDNLQPLHWENNIRKGENGKQWEAKIMY